MSTSKTDHCLNENEPNSPNCDVNQLKLFPRMWFYVKLSAKKTYSVCNSAGERIAWFFGITKPKYHAELERYDRMNEEEREAWRQAFQDIEHTDHIRESIR
ncbi:unnamed protein product [Adineta ricciae]|uniref:Uncharacterized protein n=1 Tax=Adineta ricciae TaxID=249248 RepID=A0A816BF57_ADIRI|nr:unnamed protein product [Adineta ricciae]CAF1609465.1 unnamed protein product [Adineta ricciae]